MQTTGTPRTRRLARTAAPLLPLLLALLLAGGCGGATGTAAEESARVDVSVASTAPYEGLSSGGSLSPSAAPVPAVYDHAWVTVYRVALLPDDGACAAPDPAGEGSAYDGETAPAPAAGAVETPLASPAEVDLLNLPSTSSALFLDSFAAVPAGTWRKLRLYYTNPKVHRAGATDNTALSPTAHYHLDLHFAGEGLVLGGSGAEVRVARVAVSFLAGEKGLKIVESGNRIHMRPQAFCAVTSVEYGGGALLPPSDPPPPPPAEPPAAEEVRLLEGTVASAGPSSALVTTLSGALVTVSWDGATAWSFADDAYVPSRTAAVDGGRGVASLQSGALVTALGTVDAAGALRASTLVLRFPAWDAGAVEPLDPTDFSAFFLYPSGALVFPAPSLFEALYDDGAGNALPNGFEAFAAGVPVVVRGYDDAGALSARWISFGW